MKFPSLDNGGGSGGGVSSSTFLKIKDGERIKAIFRGDPRVFRVHWAGGKSQLCSQKQDCELCKGGDKSKTRFQINVLVQVEGVWVAKVFENGYGLLKDMSTMHDEYNLEETCVWLSRSGTGTDTEYSIIPAKDNGGLKKEDVARLGGIPLNVLGSKKEETPKAS